MLASRKLRIVKLFAVKPNQKASLYVSPVVVVSMVIAGLEIEPMEPGGGFEFIDKISGGSIPREYIPAVGKGAEEAMQNGVLAGYPMVDIRVTVVDGSYHDVDSNEMAFKVAGSMGFRAGCLEAKPVILEPMMDVEVVTPEDYMGDIVGDLNRRRGRVLGMD